MRALLLAAVLLGSSSLTSFAQDRANSPASNQPSTDRVQPERTPQQSDQARGEDQKRAEDVRVRPGWRTEERDSGMDGRRQHEMGRMMGRRDSDDDRDDRTVGRNWRMHEDEDSADRDSYGRSYSYDTDRPRRRVKVCIEYADGDEYCRYRD
jgi:hypothetical protein